LRSPGISWRSRFAARQSRRTNVPIHCDGWAHFTQSGEDLAQALGIASRLLPLEQQVGKEMTAELQQEHQAEMAQRQAVASAFAQAAHNFAEQHNQQQMINAINRPRTTDCNSFGNSVSCTSY
jgi:hypothetical protein